MSIFSIFYAPGKVFEGLKDSRGAWLLPLIIDMILLVAITAVTMHFIGLENIMRQRLQNTQISPEQMQNAISRANSPVQTYISYAAAAAGGPVILLLIAGVLTVFAMVSSYQPRFGTMFSMVTLAFLPYWAVTALMTTLVLLAAPDRNLLDVSNLLATNAGAFMDKATTSKALYSFMSSMDVLSFAAILMLAYGFSKVTRSGLSAGLGAVLSIWFLYVIAKVGLGVLF